MPKYFMFVEKIVRTLDGEVDTGFLPDPLAIIHENSGKILPKSKIEKRLAEAWQRVLGIREFDVNDHFFELGGNSMKAVQIAAYLKKYNYIMEYKDLIKYPTIEKLSKHISVAG
jgi:aryl carrier-like protein